MLASFVINYLKEHDLPCSYFFFQYGDQLKKSLSTLLKSLSYQIANHLPMFRKSLLHMLDSGFNIQRAESRLIWQKVFTNNLFKIDHNQPVFCVVDALDECEQAKSFVRLLADLPAAKMPIRLLLVSRPTQLLSLEFEKIRDSVRLDLFSMDNSDSDIQRYVNEEMARRPDLQRADEDENPREGRRKFPMGEFGARGNFAMSHTGCRRRSH